MNKKILLMASILTIMSSSAIAKNEAVITGNLDNTKNSPYSFIQIGTEGTGMGYYTEDRSLKPKDYMGVHGTFSVNNVIDQGGFHSGSGGESLVNLNSSGVNVFKWGSMTADYTADGLLLYSIKQNITNPIQTVYDLDGTGIRKPEVKLTLTEMKMGNNILHDVKTGIDDTDAVNVKQLKDYVKENKTIVKSGDNNIKVAEDAGTFIVSTSKNLTELNSVNLNDGNNESHFTTEGIKMDHRGDGSEPEYKTTYNYNGIRIATNDGNATPIDEVTLTDKGLNNGDHKLTNISKGIKDTDAVNVSQLKEVENKISNISSNALNQANHYTNLQVNKGVAKASALAGLKFLDYNPKDKWSFAASVGHYRNANAVAVGAAYQPNENTLIHGGITLDGKVAYNLGISFKTGDQKQVTRHELEEQIRQLENNNIRMQEELNEIRSMLEKK